MDSCKFIYLICLLGCTAKSFGTNFSSANRWTSSLFVGSNGSTTTLLRESWSHHNDKNDETPTGTVSKECMKYLQQFSNATSQFINCTVANARPLHYCENCVGEFMTVNNVYKIMLDEDNKNSSVDCKKEILRADNVQVVLVTFNFIQNIWDKSMCDRCFDVNDTGETKVYRPTESTKKLLKLIEDTLDCFRDLDGDVSPTNQSVCTACNNLYCQANDYYEQVEGDKKLCSDLIDSMNYTRLEWGHHYKCSLAMKDPGEIWEIAAFMFAMPLLFYLGLWVHAEQELFRCRSPFGHRRLTNTE